MGKYKKLQKLQLENEKRLDKIEKHLGFNTEVSVSKFSGVQLPTPEFMRNIKPELTELPEKWCIKTDNRAVVDYCDKNGYLPPYRIDSSLYAHFPHIGGITTDGVIRKGYTEITFEQFKKWVLKEDDSKPIEIEGIKPLSIREVQVKVTSQEEANECAEIANYNGYFSNSINRDLKYFYFRKQKKGNEFGVFEFCESFKEISIQEYRERFGKSTEIDWSKVGDYVETGWEIVMIMKNKSKIEDYFTGVIIKTKEGCDFEKGLYSKTWNKKAFKLCTEPITLKNE